MDRSTLVTEARRLLAEPIDGRFYDNAEIQSWVDQELLYLSSSLKFLKREISFTGSDATFFISSKGASPRYFTASSDFIAIDKNAGIVINGIRKLPTTEKEYYSMQEKSVPDLENGNTVVSTSDFFTASFTGLLCHYYMDYIFKEEVDATRRGFLLYFDPNVSASDSITLRYIAAHPALATDAAIPYIDSQFHEMVMLGAVRRAAIKKLSAGIPVPSLPIVDREYAKMYANAELYYTDANKVPDKVWTVRSARQVKGMYNSKHYRGGSYNSSES